MENSIHKIDKKVWNSIFANKGVFDWDGLCFLEKTFSKNDKTEENWSFYYFIIRDQHDIPLLATFFTYSLWKDDMLAPQQVSEKIETIRLKDSYHMTSYVLSTGSLFTEGEHLYCNTSHPLWQNAMYQLFEEIEKLDNTLKSSMIVAPHSHQGNPGFHRYGMLG